MRSLALVVPAPEAENTRQKLKVSGQLRTDLPVLRQGADVVFAIRSAPDTLPDGARLEEREYATPEASPPRSYRQLVDIPPALRSGLPRAFDVIGDIVLIRIPPELAPYSGPIGAALLRFVPGARIVGWDRGVHGVERRRSIERIAGAGEWVTTHRENGLALEVDVEGAYFSPRLAREHERVAALAKVGERVYDLCCGVGPFALTIAAQGRAIEVVAVDLNPRAIELLQRNAQRLGLSDRLRIVEGPIEGFLPSASRCDRAILNLPHEGIKYLAQVVDAVGRGGTLHYYEVTDRSSGPGRAEELVSMIEPRDGWRAGPTHVVHPYSPQSDLVAYTLEHSKE